MKNIYSPDDEPHPAKHPDDFSSPSSNGGGFMKLVPVMNQGPSSSLSDEDREPSIPKIDIKS